LGALSAGVPLRLLMELFGWRSVIFGTGIIALLLSLSMGLCFLSSLPSLCRIRNMRSRDYKSFKNKCSSYQYIRFSSAIINAYFYLSLPEMVLGAYKG
jgi:predicted MFS family arabinose efflux permease